MIHGPSRNNCEIEYKRWVLHWALSLINLSSGAYLPVLSVSLWILLPSRPSLSSCTFRQQLGSIGPLELRRLTGGSYCAGSVKWLFWNGQQQWRIRWSEGEVMRWRQSWWVPERSLSTNLREISPHVSTNFTKWFHTFSISFRKQDGPLTWKWPPIIWCRHSQSK